MKSQKTMYGLCAALVAAKGPRVYGEGPARILGYYLTMDEIRAVYADNNFNVSPRRMVVFEHFENWKLAGWVRTTGEGEETLVWFKCPDGLNTWTNREAERHLIPGVRVVMDPLTSEVLP